MKYKIIESCVRCHYCRYECPESAIHIVGREYVIDQGKCIQCGLCADVCPICAVIDVDEKPVIIAHEPIDLEADIVVLGAGGSGIVAAARAAELAENKVIVLEKAKKTGGSAVFAHGIRINYSQWHKELGLPDIREELIKCTMDEYGDFVDETLLRNVTYAQGRFFDWVGEKCSYDDAFVMKENKEGFGVGAYKLLRHSIEMPIRKYENLKSKDQSIGPGWIGTYLNIKMTELCDKLGVKILTETAARELVMDAEGKVAGVKSHDPGGEVNISCKACIISSGNVGYNEEIMEKIAPWFKNVDILQRSAPTCTGDGLLMAQKVGAEIDYNFRLGLFYPFHEPFGFCGLRIVTRPDIMMVNLDGRRYRNESVFDDGSGRGGATFLNQRRGFSYAIIDSDNLEAILSDLIANPPDYNESWIYEQAAEEFEKELENGTALFRADTLEKLATQLSDRWDTDPELLLSEIKKYNEYCRVGVDSDFNKESGFLKPIEKGPFYAFFGHPVSEGVYGGIVSDGFMRVKKADGSGTIPGLYVTGDVNRGLVGKIPYFATPISTMTWAVCSGFLAGEQVAEYLKT